MKPTIYTTDETLEGQYTVYVVAWFAYRTFNKNFTTNSFIVNLIDKCRKTVIQTFLDVPQPFYYQVGEPASTFKI